ncbi:hypothetical protein M0812_01939 [Anaeramoeba flamelloides]|uniref:non-specific serine/threonine protein kinase n=1 Tax=Anaeramoeba flamelloides TaxID=1746091 RepID=A0AAV7YYJ6_9EUKA|nr:hypothetical protein M0812_01939 [Anaeramoeba flamelloides]
MSNNSDQINTPPTGRRSRKLKFLRFRRWGKKSKKNKLAKENQINNTYQDEPNTKNKILNEKKKEQTKENGKTKTKPKKKSQKNKKTSTSKNKNKNEKEKEKEKEQKHLFDSKTNKDFEGSVSKHTQKTDKSKDKKEKKSNKKKYNNKQKEKEKEKEKNKKKKNSKKETKEKTKSKNGKEQTTKAHNNKKKNQNENKKKNQIENKKRKSHTKHQTTSKTKQKKKSHTQTSVTSKNKQKHKSKKKTRNKAQVIEKKKKKESKSRSSKEKKKSNHKKKPSPKIQESPTKRKNRTKEPKNRTKEMKMTEKRMEKSEEESSNLELSLETSSSTDEENPEDYKKGGYHPTRVGEIFKKRYKALFKIGWGYFSTVWLVEDVRYGGKLVRTKAGKIIKKEKYLALKIVKSSKAFAQVAIDEIKLLLKSSKKDKERNCSVVRLHDHFLHVGKNGKHICMVFEFLDQKNLLSLIRKYGENQGLPIEIVKKITIQTLKGLHHLHNKCQIIHTDIKPENIMLYSKIGNIPKRLWNKLDKVTLKSEERKYRRREKERKKRKERERENEKENEKENSGEGEGETEGGDQKEQENDIENEDLNSDDFFDITKSGGENTPTKRKLSKTRLIKTLNKESGGTYKEKKTTKELDLTEQEQNILWEQIKRTKEDEKTSTLLKKISPSKIKCKIVDLGNACWFDKHFSSEIQTREYRSPEVILGHDYNWSSDIWSLGCMIFELLTGDVLFDPQKSQLYGKDEDHLALIIELFGKIPPDILQTGHHSRKLLDKKGELKHIKKFHFWPLEKVLHEKYKFSEKNAKQISKFLLPMFHYRINKRASAKTMFETPFG